MKFDLVICVGMCDDVCFICDFLQQVQLFVVDLESSEVVFFVVDFDGVLVGVVGLQIFGVLVLFCFLVVFDD